MKKPARKAGFFCARAGDAYFFEASDGLDGVAGAELDDGAPEDGAAEDGAPEGALDAGGVDGAVDAGGVEPVLGVDDSFFWQAASARAAAKPAAMRSVRFIVVLLSDRGNGGRRLGQIPTPRVQILRRFIAPRHDPRQIRRVTVP
ncbi:MAG TPA: hypothetical protein VI319_06290 [Burkholderiales bacterium]